MKYTSIIIGSGIAGMTAALRIAEFGNVLLLTKDILLSGSTPMAQGGIAVVTDEMHDSFASHIEDTLKAGGYENVREAVEMMVYEAPAVLQDLEKWGIHFHGDRHKEGGHKVPRILHVGDKTGKTIAEHLATQVKNHPNINILEHFYAENLILKNGKVVGVMGVGNKNVCSLHYADTTVLATGGACALFATATVPEDAIGDGIAMAIRAGAKTHDLYRIQFHPTALDMPGTPKFLLSEALRGAGAYIVNAKGERFIDELLPRDIVAKAIFEERKKGPVYLDIRHLSAKGLSPLFQERFPRIYEHLTKEFQLDPAKDLLPIAPAAHYFGGGISVNLDGETSLPHLFASGECTYSGVHGRNRLASNSLLEGLVYSKRIAEKIRSHDETSSKRGHGPLFPEGEDGHPRPPLHDSSDIPFVTELRERMDKNFGIVRNAKDIKNDLQWISHISPEGLFAKNMKTVAEAMWKEFLQYEKCKNEI